MAVISVDAVLFDMDGTLINSTPGVLKAWETFGEDYGLDPTEAAHAAHGRRLYDTLREICKIEDEQTLQDEITRFELGVINGGPVVLPGAAQLIEQISQGGTHTNPGWTIVTSATIIYAPPALKKCGLPLPPGIVTSSDVAHGKPHPAPYLAGAAKCGVDARNTVVIEDAPSGIRSGKNAGAKTIAVCTSHTKDQIVASGSEPDFLVPDLTYISAKWADGKVELTIRDS